MIVQLPAATAATRSCSRPVSRPSIPSVASRSLSAARPAGRHASPSATVVTASAPAGVVAPTAVAAPTALVVVPTAGAVIPVADPGADRTRPVEVAPATPTLPVRCSRRSAPVAARRRKSPSSPGWTVRFTAVTASKSAGPRPPVAAVATGTATSVQTGQ